MGKGSKPQHARAAGKGPKPPAKPRSKPGEEPPAGDGQQSAKPLEVTRAEALRILVCPDRTFAKLEADGVVVPLRRGRPGQASVYDLRELVPAYLRHVVNGKPSDDRAARAARDLKQAEKLDLEISTKRGELVALSDVVLAGQNFVKAWTAMVRALPRQMVQDGLIPREQESGVMRLCLEVLTEISKWQTVADTTAAAKGAAP